MQGDWYYATDGAPIGPVTFDALLQLVQRGQVKREHLVWTNSMTGWEPASTVAELWPSPPPAPSRPPPTPTVPPIRATAPASAPLEADRGDFSQSGVRAGNWIVRHWRGDLPLWKSYWLVGALVGLGAGFLVGVIIGLLEALQLPPSQLVAISIAVAIAWIAVFIWQFVGIWRAAGNHIVRTNGAWRRFWAILARIAVVLGCVQVIAVVVSLLGLLLVQ